MKQSGFTLLEFLVSMMIFVLVASSSYAVLSTAGAYWERGEARTEDYAQARHAFRFLRQTLASALPVAVLRDGKWHIRFEGGSDRFRFFMHGSRHVGQRGLYQADVAYEDSELRLTMRKADEKDSGASLSRSLIEHVAAAEFSYFGSDGPGKPAAWHSEWRERHSLPRLVRLRLRSETTGEWPELTVRLRVDESKYHQF